MDYSAATLNYTLHAQGQWDRVRGDIRSLPFKDCSVEAVLCLEVLEHLIQPERALEEICRVCSRYAIMSVPNEPWFRLANLARLKNIRALGNAPGHIQHWGVQSFADLVASYLRVRLVTTSFPWAIVVAARA